MKRILSVWWPRLAIERWARTSDLAPDSPVVLTIEGAHGFIIHAVTLAATERGARPGARLADARALDPTLVAIPADPGGDAAWIKRLARWASRWSPLVEVDGDGLRLDVTGVAHLFGGEAGLIEDVRTRFSTLGLTSQIAIAPTAGAAWALARFPSPQWGEGDSARLSGERGLLAVLSLFPVAALRLESDTVRTLERLGLKTIGALAQVPRRALARRFRDADNVLGALDRALGRTPEPLTGTPRDPPPRSTLRLEEPATYPEAAAQALERLIPSLVHQLEQRHLGARRLSLIGFRVDGSMTEARVATSIASRDPKHLQRLLEDKAAMLDPEFGFDGFVLEAGWAEPLGSAQDHLIEEPSGTSDLARLVDRLSVKLGLERVRRPQPVESHSPERANGWVRAVNSSPRFRGEGDHPQQMLGRSLSPQRLLDRPEAIAVIYATPEGLPRRFVWRRAVHDIARLEGPERVAPEWWRQPSSARLRDYYRVEDAEGRRYWIYREGLAGDGRGGAPNWYLHGLFG